MYKIARIEVDLKIEKIGLPGELIKRIFEYKEDRYGADVLVDYSKVYRSVDEVNAYMEFKRLANEYIDHVKEFAILNVAGRNHASYTVTYKAEEEK